VRARNPEARAVVITGCLTEMDPAIQQVVTEGADAVCFKPFDVARLLTTVDQLARHKKVTN